VLEALSLIQYAHTFFSQNDDFFVGRPVEKSRFFTFEGYPKVAFQDDWYKAGHICRNDPTGGDKQHSYFWAAMNTYRLMDAAFGHEERSLVMHQAYPLTKSLYARAKTMFPDQFRATSENHFRTRKDINPYFLALFTGFHDGTAIKLGRTEYPTNTVVKLTDDDKKNKASMESFRRDRYDVFYINDHTSDTVSLDELDKLADDMQVFMASLFPEPSDFELVSSPAAATLRKRQLL